MEFLEGFEAYIRNEKRYSDLTLKAYKSDLEQFSDYLSETYDVHQPPLVTTQMIRSWIVTLMDNDLGARSVNRKVSTLKSFFKYLKREARLSENPTVGITAPKVRKRLPEYVEADDMKKLFDEGMEGDSFHDVRDYLMMMLFYCTGMRRAELMGLTVDACDHRNGSIRVLGKGNKERIIPITQELSALIRRYLELRNQSFGATINKQLFLTDRGEPVYPKFIHRTVTAQLSKVSTAQKKSPHILRHTFATHMLNNGADLNAIKEILGHANLSATQVYTHNSVEKLRQIYKQAHPKA